MSNKTLSLHPAIPAVEVRALALNFGQPFVPQVTSHFESLGDLRGSDVIGLPGQAIAAILSLPIIEMALGMPHDIKMLGFGQDAKVAGSIDLDNFRHNVVRPRRRDMVDGEKFAGYTVLDGAGRGLTLNQLAELATIINVDETAIRTINVSMGQVNLAMPTEEQQRFGDVLIASGLTRGDWQSGRLIFLPGGHGGAAAVQATAIYALTETWVRTIRLNKVGDTFVVQEMVDPQELRQFGVHLRASWESGAAPVSVDRELFNELLAAHAETKLGERLAALVR